MTTYTAIPDTDKDAESIIDENLMTLLRDNPIAITEGASGAPKNQLASMDTNSVDTSQIVAAAIGRSEIANSVTTSAGALNGPISVEIALNDWALFPMIHISNNNEACAVGGHNTDGGSAASPRFNIWNNVATSETYDIDHRWIIAA